ncbi:MAG: family radical protein [Phenylobacterium sp.]|nr:family radical protein [Phenylobacterium sp.]
MSPALRPGLQARGRGARSNRSGRFEAQEHAAFDDGWTPEEQAGEVKLATTVQPMKSRTIIARNASSDLGFDRSINSYRGCSYGCICLHVAQVGQ